jgi:hypothetical protein
VKSVPEADDARVVIRIMVVKQTLILSEMELGSSGGLTYNPPSAKHPITPHLFFFDKDNEYSKGIGKHKMKKSVTMLIVA